jgi:hypothetical protein
MGLPLGRKPKAQLPAPVLNVSQQLDVPDDLKDFTYPAKDGRTISLTRQQQLLLTALLLGGMDIAAASAHAGYATVATASASLRLPHVQEAWSMIARQRLQHLAPRAILTMERLLKAKSEKVRLDAAVAILDRTDLRATADQLVKPHVRISINLDGAGSATDDLGE